jgi:hypothetical protein
MSTEYNPHRLQSGVYQVFNNVTGTVLDLAGYDFKHVIGAYTQFLFSSIQIS